MAINLVRRYSAPQPDNGKSGSGGGERKKISLIGASVVKLVKISFWLSAIIVIYLVLYSQIVEYRSRKVIIEETIKVVKGWHQRLIMKKFTVAYREKKRIRSIDLELSREYRGRILLQYMEAGWLWYVFPDDLKRYYIGEPDDLVNIIEKLGEYSDIKPLAAGDKLPDELLGRFIITASSTLEYPCEETSCPITATATSSFVNTAADGLTVTGTMYYQSPNEKEAYQIKNLDDAIDFFRDKSALVQNDKIRTIDVGDVGMIK